MAERADSRYWDVEQCRWVRFAAPSVEVPAPAEPADDEQVATFAEVDVRSR
jgi:hypothetical protein